MANKIGIFDSGVGGLTVLEKIMKMMPHEQLLYVGDNANCPYGEKTKEELFVLAGRIVEFFLSQNVNMIVFACNTTSANVLDDLRRKYPKVLMIGVIDSTVQSFVMEKKNQVLVIATHATIRADKYASLIHSYVPRCQVYSLETPKLVPLIEDGSYKQGIQDVLSEYLLPYQGKIDSIILGCTHYPIVQDQIQSILGDIAYVSSSDAVADEIYAYFKMHNLLSYQKRSVEIYTTGKVEEFIYAASNFFDFNTLEVKHIDLPSK